MYAKTSKINFSEIKQDLLARVEEIEESNDSQSVKTKKFQRLAEHIKNKLYYDDRVKEGNKLALSTVRKYLTECRHLIAANGYKHHSLFGKKYANTVPKLIADYPEFTDLFERLRNAPAKHLDTVKQEVLKEIMKSSSAGARAAYNALRSRDLRLHHEVTRHLVLESFDVDKFKSQSRESLSDKQQNTVKLSHAKLMQMIDECLASDSYGRVALGLALASGRRAIEILLTGTFKHVDKNTVLFDGQAKKRAGAEFKPYPIPLLIDTDRFIEHHNKLMNMNAVVSLHDSLDGLDHYERNTAFNRRTAKNLSEIAKRNLGADRAFKDTRAIYARICLDLLHDTSKTDEVAYTRSLLGHDSDSAQLNYKQFVIDYDAALPDAPTADTQPLDDIDDAILKTKKRGLLNLHKKLKQWCIDNPERLITRTALIKEVGAARATINEYEREFKPSVKAIEQYNKSKEV